MRANANGQAVTTDGHLLGGRVSYRQSATGFRSGLEPVLLAATIPARPDEHVLEAGTGAGAAVLCLSARVAGVYATGVEADPATAHLATVNAEANGFNRIGIIADRIETATFGRMFDHAMANPPYHLSGGPLSPDVARVLAKRGSETLIQNWIERLSGVLRSRGSLTLVAPAALVPTCLQAMAEFRCPCTVLFPLWPKPGQPAKLVLLRGIKDARTPMRLLSGLLLHQPDGIFTDKTRDILSQAAALPLNT